MSAASRPFDVSFRMVLAIALPMTLAFLSTPLIGITDMAVIGQAGDAALIGAVALGSLMFDFIGTTFNFLRSGTTGLVAQAMGAGDREAEAITLWRAVIFALVAGTIVIVLHQRSWRSSSPRWRRATPWPRRRARTTTSASGGTPLMFANYAILGWLLGLSRAAPASCSRSCSASPTWSGSVLAVMVFDLGVFGVAAASVAAEGLTLLAGGIVVARALGRRPRPALAAILERIGFVRMLSVNGDILVRSMVLIATFTFFTAISTRFGDVTLAANAILLNVFLLSSYFLDGLATAAEQLGGRAVGARWRPAFDGTVKFTVLAGLGLSALLAVVALAASVPFVKLMTTAPDVRAEALRYFPWAAVTPLVGALAFVMDGIYIGATWSATMRNMMLVSAGLFLVVWWVATPSLGNDGLWLALLTFLGGAA